MTFTLFIYGAAGQMPGRPLASVYTGAGAYSTRHIDVFSFLLNPAALAGLKAGAVGVLGERRFLMKELNYYNAVAGIRTNSGNFGLVAGIFGFSEYRETTISIAHGRRLSSKMDLGVQFNYHSLQINGYGQLSSVGFELGSIFHFSPKFHLGFHVTNPFIGSFGKQQQEKLTSVYSTGFGYDASDKFFASLELLKEEDQPINVNAGLQYRLLPFLLARMGISSATTSWYIGMGLCWNEFRMDLTSSYHPWLGLTPGLVLIMEFKEKQK